MKGTCDFTHTAAAGWMKMAGAVSPDPREALEELDMVESVEAAETATGEGARDQIDAQGVLARGRESAARG